MSDAERVQILRDAIRKVEHYVVGPMAHWTLADALERTKPTDPAEFHVDGTRIKSLGA